MERKAANFTSTMKLRERDARARVIADSCVAMAMQKLSDEMPDELNRSWAHRVAQLAASLLVSGIYIDDAELRALKEENEQLKERLTDVLMTIPPKLSIPIITK